MAAAFEPDHQRRRGGEGQLHAGREQRQWRDQEDDEGGNADIAKRKAEPVEEPGGENQHRHQPGAHGADRHAGQKQIGEPGQHADTGRKLVNGKPAGIARQQGGGGTDETDGAEAQQAHVKAGNGQKMRQSGATKQVIDRLFDMPPVADQQRGGDSARRPVHAGGDFVRAALAERGKTHPPVKLISRQRRGRTARNDIAAGNHPGRKRPPRMVRRAMKNAPRRRIDPRCRPKTGSGPRQDLGREGQPQDLPLDHGGSAMDPVDLQPDAQPAVEPTVDLPDHAGDIRPAAVTRNRVGKMHQLPAARNHPGQQPADKQNGQPQTFGKSGRRPHDRQKGNTEQTT